MSIIIHTLIRQRDGTINVVTNKGTAYNCSENIVRCALGENDMNYLLKSRTREIIFSITESEFADMLRM